MTADRDAPVQAAQSLEDDAGRISITVVKLDASGEHIVALDIPAGIQTLGLSCGAAANLAHGIAQAAARALELNATAQQDASGSLQ